MSASSSQPVSLHPAARWAAVLILGSVGILGVAQSMLAPAPAMLGDGTGPPLPTDLHDPQSPAVESPVLSGKPSRGVDRINPARRININTATAAELDLLPGIGPALAGRIIAYRQANGRYSTLDDLDEVAGIGPKTIAKLVPYAEAE